MDKNATANLIKVMQAYVEGKTIEARYKENGNAEWEYTEYPKWHQDFEYRVKTEPKYIPFTYEDDFIIGKVIKDKSPQTFKGIVCASNKLGVALGVNNFYDYGHLLENFTFLDGTPCGKLEV